jgi:hypothetical protein
LTTNTLRLSGSQRSLYTAYEVCQAVWIWQRDGVEERFLLENAWARKYVPKFWLMRARAAARAVTAGSYSPVSWLHGVGNWLAFQVQYLYMLPHMTRELVSLQKAFFHPRPTKTSLMIQCQRNIHQLLQ